MFCFECHPGTALAVLWTLLALAGPCAAQEKPERSEKFVVAVTPPDLSDAFAAAAQKRSFFAETKNLPPDVAKALLKAVDAEDYDRALAGNAADLLVVAELSRNDATKTWGLTTKVTHLQTLKVRLIPTLYEVGDSGGQENAKQALIAKVWAEIDVPLLRWKLVEAHGDPIGSVAFNGPFLVSMDKRGGGKVWDVATGKFRSKFAVDISNGIVGSAVCIGSPSPEGRIFATWFSDLYGTGQVALWTSSKEDGALTKVGGQALEYMTKPVPDASGKKVYFGLNSYKRKDICVGVFEDIKANVPTILWSQPRVGPEIHFPPTMAICPNGRLLAFSQDIGKNRENAVVFVHDLANKFAQVDKILANDAARYIAFGKSSDGDFALLALADEYRVRLVRYEYAKTINQRVNIEPYRTVILEALVPESSRAALGQALTRSVVLSQDGRFLAVGRSYQLVIEKARVDKFAVELWNVGKARPEMMFRVNDIPEDLHAHGFAFDAESRMLAVTGPERSDLRLYELRPKR